MRLSVPIIWAVVLSGSGPASAQEGMSFDDPFSLSPPTAVCWRMFDLIPARAQASLGQAIEKAAEQTRPEHAADVEVRQVGPDAAGCELVLSGARRRERTRSGFVHDVYIERDGVKIFERATEPFYPLQSRPESFSSMWTEAWSIAAPAPLPEPEPEPEPKPQDASEPEGPSSSSFVDSELAETRAEQPKQPDSTRSPTWLTVLATAGVTSRDLGANFGRALDQGATAALGVRAGLHFGQLIGERHRLDFEAAYWRQLASAELEGVSLGVDADRTRLSLGYAHRIGAKGPFLGGGLGFEFRRFTFEEGTGVLSIEYSVLRPGLDVEQALVESASVELGLLGRGHLRLPLDDSSVSNDLGADFGGGFFFRHAVGFVAELTADYTLQSGSSSQGTFDDAFFDMQLGLGWTL